jgi:hypothetical protein
MAGGGDVGRQPLSRKSRLREFMLALRPFNLRMQALRYQTHLSRRHIVIILTRDIHRVPAPKCAESVLGPTLG